MMKKHLVLALTTIFCVATSHIEESKMIVDVLKATAEPVSVVSTLCWAPEKIMYLFSMLNGGEIFMVNLSNHTRNINIINSDSVSVHQIVFLADIRCNNSEDMFKQADKIKLFRRPYRWILLGDDYDNNTTIIPEVLNHIKNILPDSEVIISQNFDNSSFKLHSIFRATSESQWNIENYGKWSALNGLRRTNNMTTAIRRKGLEEISIRIVYVILDNDTMKHLRDYKNNHIDSITKTGFLIANILMDFMKCKREYIFTNTWGYYVNGTWNGVMGYLTREEADLGGTPMFIVKHRTYAIDYLIRPTPTNGGFLFRQPPLSYENNLYLLTFKSSVWYSTLATIFLLLFVLFASALWEYKKTKTKFDGTTTLEANVSDVTIFVLGAVCQQGNSVELKSSLGRVVMFILFLTSTFLYTSYSANIVALRQYSSSNIRTLQDLLNSKLELGVQDTVYNKHYFSTATEPVRKAIYQKKVAPPGKKPKYLSVEEGIKKMREGLFAFNVELPVGYKFIEKYFYESEKCGLHVIPYLTEMDPWLTSMKNSPYREMFKIGLMRIQEHGISDRENNMFYTKKPRCTSRSGSFESVSLIDSYPAILVLVYGALLAFALLMLEILYYKLNPSIMIL